MPLRAILELLQSSRNTYYMLPNRLTENSALNISVPFCFQVHSLSSVTDSLIISIFLKPGKEQTQDWSHSRVMQVPFIIRRGRGGGGGANNPR